MAHEKDHVMTVRIGCYSLNNNKGIALLSLMALTAMIPAIILLLLSMNTSQAQHARYFNSADTVLKMKEIKQHLMNQSLDIDADGFFEPPAADENNHLKTNVPYNTKDPWGNDFIYCTWDLGALNGSDSNYSTNHAPPPGNAALSGRLVSFGADRIFNGATGTHCTASSSTGDDIFIEFTQGEIGQVPGWRREVANNITDTNKIKLITQKDTVVVGESAATPPSSPTVKMEVQGGVLKATDGLVIQTTTVDPQNPINGQIWLLQ
ncbi:hypothetical protein [Trichlorobacter sp.]|uniref:hypothetical protein n=1 Tax=Trichlorobacter sp. TaxID=2911007 RepID=UPI002A36BFFA|nr:hypothetical protein [Trichlorobacter sp.]MDY0383718.1 hypothetical protein [Trichlorobacter sp.]